MLRQAQEPAEALAKAAVHLSIPGSPSVKWAVTPLCRGVGSDEAHTGPWGAAATMQEGNQQFPPPPRGESPPNSQLLRAFP